MEEAEWSPCTCSSPRHRDEYGRSRRVRVPNLNAIRGERLIAEQDDQQSRRSTGQRVRVFSTVVAICLAAVLLYVSLRGIQWGRVWQILANARRPYVALCCLLSYSTLFLRSF